MPVDFSANSRRALDYARELALKFDATIHLIHVCDTAGIMLPAFDAYAIAATDWKQRLQEEARRGPLRSAALSHCRSGGRG